MCVTSGVRPPCVGSLAPRLRLGRAPEPRGGQARWNSSPRPRGRARQRPRPSPGGSGETEFVPEPRKVERLSYSFLQFFIPLIWVSYFMVPNNMALALAQYEDLF